MSKAPLPAAGVRELENGRNVTIHASNGFVVRRLCLCIAVGLLLLGVLVLIVISTLQQGGSWVLLALNLRVWALVAGITGCLVLGPWVLLRRPRRAVGLVLSRDGIAETSRGVLLPNTLLAWNEIEQIEFERPRALHPRILSFRLTEAAAHERGLHRPHQRLVQVETGFELSHRRLHPILVAAHARFAQRVHQR
ncbi:hypothetical protein SAMN02982929_03749 [Saccharopolyspora kobensis]|uniref:Uncharacterized protein n=1 Tax=Saccharopolyspora kobensis TaxID=146035 RepID=A0A1H6CZ35_9PSEU|nr:hypothetical protein [Saccharopolyspora kobensis]SEG78409.1 hypothetical protein SAMN02982929_03749 [Saccharopolyspora kobensis]SFD05292.1 hypothetical protein SAMN05216506_102344 [Saccharopolyspora kobensis]